MLRTYVYVDGLNLFHRALKGTAFKWLDLLALSCALLRPENRIDAIRYYTAGVSGKRDPQQPVHQHAYLRALSTIPQVSIHRSHFLVHARWMPMADSGATMLAPPPMAARVLRTEEKGSDVNLASHLLRDAFLDAFDVAVVVSNDTDLIEPIRIVRDEIGKPIGVVPPGTRPAASLIAVASFVRHLDPARLAAAQFPPRIPGTTIRRPAAWAAETVLPLA